MTPYLWVQEMVSTMLQKGKVLMRVDGPYGLPYGPGWQRYSVLVIFAGGIGVRPSLYKSPDLTNVMLQGDVVQPCSDCSGHAHAGHAAGDGRCAAAGEGGSEPGNTAAGHLPPESALHLELPRHG